MTVYVEYAPFIAPFKSPDDHVTSTNRHIVSLCSSAKEGTSKLTNKLYYLYQKNKRRGVNYVLVSLEILKRELNRSEDSVRRYIEEGIEAGLIIVEKVRDRFCKLRYKFILTAKLLQIKQCGTVAEGDGFLPNTPETVPNFYTQKPQNAAKRSQNAGDTTPINPLFTAGLKDVSEPLYQDISLKRLNSAREDINQTAIETLETSFSKVEGKQPSEFEKEGMEFLNGIQEINQNLPKPNPINAQSVLKAYRNLKKSHFGGIDKAKEYLEGFAGIPFVMGQKPTKKGNIFNAKIGYILSGNTIEQYWEKKGPFNVWSSKEPTQEDDMPRKKEPIELPLLSLTEVLANAKNPFDKAVKPKLFELLGEKTYKSWFYGTNFVARGMRDGQPQFEINGNHARDLVTTRYGAQLKAAFRDN